MAPTSMKLAGNVTDPCARLTVTMLVFQRLAQYLKQSVPELGQFVQEQHAAVAQADFARPRVMPAPDQPHIGRSVVRRTERSLPYHWLVRRQETADAVYLGDLQRFLIGQRRQNGAQRAGEQSFAAPRRPHHDNVVTTGGGNLKSALHVLLPLDVGKIDAERIGKDIFLDLSISL